MQLASYVLSSNLCYFRRGNGILAVLVPKNIASYVATSWFYYHIRDSNIFTFFLYVPIFTCAFQGQRKVFIIGQAKLSPEHYSIEYNGSLAYTTTDISFLSVIVSFYKSNWSKNYTATLFIMYFLHNRIPCEHNHKLNVWVANNLASLAIFFYLL